MRPLIPALVVAVVLAAVPVFAGFEVRDLDPISEKDLSMFKIEGEGEWALDDKTDAVHTFIVCPKTAQPTSLLFRSRKFRDGFQVKWEMQGGSKQKGLTFSIVPEKGERIVVPWSARLLMKKDWHSVMVRVEDGKAYAKIDGEEQEKVAVPDNEPLTFALDLGKRQEATLRKLRVKFLVINREQTAPEKGFVRIFDGKTLEGWTQIPEGSTHFAAKDQRIEGELPRQGEVREAGLIFTDVQFQDFTLKMRVASGARRLALIGRYGEQNGPQATYTDISGYFPGDKDWNDVLWEVKGKTVSLTVNGNRVWTQQAQTSHPIRPHIVLFQGGKCILRDIQVKPDGQFRAGASWARYAKESGAAAGGAAGKPEDGANPGAGSGGTGSGGRSFQMFNGKDLTDWNARPVSAWRVAGDKLVGITYDLGSEAQLVFKKFVFEEYRISFSLQKGCANASLLVKGFTKESGNQTLVVKFEDGWFGEDRFQEFEAAVMDGVFTLHAGGKKVKTQNVAKAAGVFGFVVGKEGAIGVKDIWFNKKK